MEYSGKAFPLKLTRLQFPIKKSFTLTINKVQVQSETKCGILLKKKKNNNK